jgi:predicted nucleic acid-binding protein
LVERPSVVVDASVVARWYVNNPPLVPPARRVQADSDGGSISLLAPENLVYEVAGVIHQAVFARRLNAQRGREQLERFLATDITLVETNDLVVPAWELSVRYGCSYYDAIYLEIARRQDCPFVHADGRLHRALAGRFPREVWIEDYNSP